MTGGKKMKKLLIGALSLLTVSLCAAGLVGCGSGSSDSTQEEEKVETITPLELKYELNSDSNSYKVKGIESGTDTNLVIPSTYNQLPVTVIAQYAFASQTFTTVTIPNSITDIEDGAFKNSQITSVTIPDSVTTIRRETFKDCRKLTSVTLSSKVTVIETEAFYGAEELTSITIPDTTTQIGASAFENCEKLATISLPSGVMDIGPGIVAGTAYYNDAQNWDNGVLYIGNHLIKGNRSVLTSTYTVKENTIDIAISAFNNCDELTAITLPETLVKIGSQAFYYCRKLAEITIPASVVYIGADAFVDSGISKAKFEKTDGWYYKTTLTETDISSSILNSPTNAAGRLSTYSDIGSYSWYRRTTINNLTD
jgi:hypothetical protein